MDISEEPIMIIKKQKLNYVNKAFLCKFRDMIIQFEALSEDIDLNSDDIHNEDEQLEP